MKIYIPGERFKINGRSKIIEFNKSNSFAILVLKNYGRLIESHNSDFNKKR